MSSRSFSKYSDLNENPTSDRDVIIKDDAAINQAINNLLEIIRGERLFNNNGLDPESELFELGGDGDAEDLLNDIINEIEVSEPRINLNIQKTNIAPDYDNNRYVLSLYFTIVGSNQEQMFVRSL